MTSAILRTSTSAWRLMTKRRGDRRWDAVVWGTGIVGLAGFPILALIPEALPLVWFALVAVPINGPFSPILPAAFEPLIMEVAKYAPAIAVTLVGLVVQLYAEFFNWHIYAWVLDRRRLQGFRSHRHVQRAVGYFSRSPFITVVVFAFTPLPFWVARILAILQRMPLAPYFLATAIGRLPRLFFYAWLGDQLQLSGALLAGIGVGSGVAVVLWRVLKRRPVLEDTVLGADPAPAANQTGVRASHSPIPASPPGEAADGNRGA